MSNMSYCRFSNTLSDLEDCFEHMEDDDISKSELSARNRLIDLCRDIVDQYTDIED
jgi:hypothetical protein